MQKPVHVPDVTIPEHGESVRMLVPKRERMIQVRFPDGVRTVKFLNFSTHENWSDVLIVIEVPEEERAGLQSVYDRQQQLEQSLGTSSGVAVFTVPIRKVVKSYREELFKMWTIQRAAH